ncbi:hypothetical protein Tco_1119951, partial [Tanacetum coccineum]
LEKDLSFTDQFFVEKPQEEEPGKTNAGAEVQSMVSVPIHQDTSSVPPMTTLVIDLTKSQSDSPLPTSTTTISTITTTTTTLPPPPPQPQQSTANPILVKRIGELEQHMADLIQNNLALEESQVVEKIVTDAVDWAMQAPLRARFRDLPIVDMKEILQQRMRKLVKKRRKRCDVPRTPSGSPPSQPPHPPPLAGASGAPSTLGASSSSQLPPPLPPPSIGTSGSAQQQYSNAPSLSKTAALASQSMAWTTCDTRYESSGVSGAQELSPTDSLMHEDSILDEQWKPLPEEERPATPEPAWIIPSSNVSDVENNWASALVSTSETPADNSLLAKTGDMTTFMKCSRWRSVTRCSQIRLTGQIRKETKSDSMSKDHCLSGSRPALSISKMKATRYPDFGLELLVPKQMWIEDVCTYDISVKYGISHCVVRIKAYSRYGYDYLSEIVLRKADFQEHTIAKKDFKNLYPSDFEDLNLLLLQGHLDHHPLVFRQTDANLSCQAMDLNT